MSTARKPGLEITLLGNLSYSHSPFLPPCQQTARRSHSVDAHRGSIYPPLPRQGDERPCHSSARGVRRGRAPPGWTPASPCSVGGVTASDHDKKKKILASLIKFTSITYLNDTSCSEPQLRICNVGSCTNTEQNKQITHNLTKQSFHSTCLL